MRELPSGTVTFLFTDIEGSTRLLDELGPEGYAEALAEHRRVLRAAFAMHGGVEVDTQGDAFFVAFPTAPGALAAAAQAQAALALPVRMGVHTGTPHVAEEGYVGMDVNRAARIAAAGHGGQVLVSVSTRQLADGHRLRDLGDHRFKDLAAAERVYQLGDDDYPPLKTLYRTNLPVPATPFLGRQRELGEVRAFLELDAIRLLTLTGPGGSGKTRLALHAAAAAADRYPDGVWWVPLAPLTDPASVLDAAGQPVGAASGRIAEAIGDRTLLLLLDNFEHVIGAAADVGRLLAACPNLDVLVTSRERLQLAAEHIYPVPTLARVEARMLFVERARTLRPGFEAGNAVDAICERLDDLPLALELAAARIVMLSPEQLVERLGRRLDVLRGGRDAETRQQTLRATIEWSYELLEPEEQALFAQLAVFAGGCTLDAAEAVCDAQLDVLQSLVEKSLVRVRDDDRFWMLETIREFALERFEASETAEATRRRHAEHFLALAQRSGMSVDAMGRAPQRYGLALPERYNLRAAVTWAMESDVELGLKIAIASENLWVTIDPAEGARMFSSLLDRAHGVDGALLARGWRDHGGCLDMADEYDAAERAYARSGEVAAAAGDANGVAHAKFRLSMIVRRRGDDEQAQRLLEEALQTWQQAGDAGGEMQALGALGMLELRAGNRAAGYELVERSLAMARTTGWPWWEAQMLTVLAVNALREDRLEEGELRAREQLAVVQATQDRSRVVHGLALLAWAAAARGRDDRARTLWAAIEAEESKGFITRWYGSFRDECAAHIPAGSLPSAPRSVDEAVEYALSVD